MTSNDYVRVFALDFAKVFDTVRHSSLMCKFAKINLPDAVYNCINDFFNSRTHCTKFQGEVSELADIFASVVQGSGLGPAACRQRGRPTTVASQPASAARLELSHASRGRKL